MKLISLTLALFTLGALTLMADSVERCEQIRENPMQQKHEPSEKELEVIEKRVADCIESESAREERHRAKEEALRERMEERGIDYDAIKELNRPKKNQE